MVLRFQKVLLLGAFLFLFLNLFSPGLVFANNNADANKSTLAVGPSSIPADGVTTATITIAVKDSLGNTLSGDHITLTSTSDSGLSINGSSYGTTSWTAATDSNGNVTFTIKSSNASSHTDTFTASDVSSSPAVTLGSGTNNNVAVNFTVPSSSNSVCSDAAPGSTPQLVSAAPNGSDQITLTWTDATDPVNHYLLAYGTASGQYIYGNPNIGGQGTTSYDVGSLAKGTTYYFVVRAINGCNPGSYSNEIFAVAGESLTPTPTQEDTSSSIPNSNSDNSQQNVDNSTVVLDILTDTPVPQPTLTPTPAPKLAMGIGIKKIIIYALFIIIVGSVGVIYWRKFKNDKKIVDPNVFHI